MPSEAAEEYKEKVQDKTYKTFDGVEVVVGPDEMSNHVPLADYGTTYRPSPKAITDFLGYDAHANVAPFDAEEHRALPAQGFVPPSNHWGENLVTGDRDLSALRRELILHAYAGETPSLGGPVSVALSDMDYDPESEAGDIIPDRDKPEDSGGGGEVEPPTEPEPGPEQQPSTSNSNLPPLP